MTDDVVSYDGPPLSEYIIGMAVLRTDPGALIKGLLRIRKSQADCRRRQVAAVIALDGYVVGTGFNSLPDGSCTEGDCPRGLLSYDEAPRDTGYKNPAHPCHAVHAEEAALREAGEKAVGAIVYVTDWPCDQCYPLLKNAGVAGIIKVVMK